MNIVFIVLLLHISQIMWPRVCNPYSANFHGRCVINPLLVGCGTPCLASTFSPWHDSLSMFLCAQVHFRTRLFPHSAERLFALRAEIVDNASLSMPNMLCDSILSIWRPTFLVDDLGKNLISHSAALTSHILHSDEGPPHLSA